MDYESERTRSLGCWDAPNILTGSIDAWTTISLTPDFEPADEFCSSLIDVGFGKDCAGKVRNFWTKSIKRDYHGDGGRKRARMAAINLRERDGLLGRLRDVACPVLWLHGTSDAVYSVANAEEEIQLFANAPEANLKTIHGGQHFLSFSHPDEVSSAVINFVAKWNK
ncbi:MAG: hypothetical protein Q9214_007988 [Letrouitia sp. 1 TL-2023]